MLGLFEDSTMSERLSDLTERMRGIQARGDTAFLAWCLLNRRNFGGAAELAASHPASKRYPAVARRLKAAVAAGSLGGSTWGEDFADANQTVTPEWLSWVTAGSVLSLPWRRVAPHTRTIVEDVAGDATFLAEGEAQPITRIASADITLEPATVRATCVFSNELTRTWNPATEAQINFSLKRAISTRIDRQFCDPSVAGGASTPAAITYGISPVSSTGSTLAAIVADCEGLLQRLDDAALDLRDAVFLGHPRSATHIASVQIAAGMQPTLTSSGGTFLGLPFLATPGASASGSPTARVLLAASLRAVLLADAGEADLTLSDSASIEMSDAPTNSAASGAGATLTSLFQTDSVALKVARRVSWKRTDADAVQFMLVGY
jgi:hypothetical protein